jgi:hypothetical protein
MIGFDLIDQLTGGKLGIFDLPCPACSPHRSTPANRRKKVFRIWRIEPNFATYFCVHCGEHGHVRDRDGVGPDPDKLAKAHALAAEQGRIHKEKRLSKARWLWSVRVPPEGTIVETYLREARRYGGPLHSTFGLLPARDEYPPAMIAAIGLAAEPKPGELVIESDAVKGVHITRLLPDGSDRERGDKAKIMIGNSIGWPIVLAPPNNLLGLVITEGIEDSLAVHEATGLGAWAAGGAMRMPALAAVMPSYIECVTIYAHRDNDGRRGAIELARALDQRGVEVFMEGLTP